MTPLHHAIEKGNIELVRLLLTRPEIDVNKRYVLNLNTFSFSFTSYHFI